MSQQNLNNIRRLIDLHISLDALHDILEFPDEVEIVAIRGDVLDQIVLRQVIITLKGPDFPITQELARPVRVYASYSPFEGWDWGLDDA